MKHMQGEEKRGSMYDMLVPTAHHRDTVNIHEARGGPLAFLGKHTDACNS